jgi:hypothetical protein
MHACIQTDRHACASSSSSLSFSDLVKKKKELASEEQSIKHYLHAPMHVARERERERDREKRGPWNLYYGSDKTFFLLLPLSLSLFQFSLH